MQISQCEKSDYDQIVTHIDEFWGSDRTLSFHHPMFVSEFGNTTFVIRNGTEVAAYLFGFFSQSRPTAYIHLVGTRKYHRKKGLARKLYAHFISIALNQGCTKIKAITTPGNKDSIAFHQSLGFEMVGKPNRAGTIVVKNYSGLEQDRVVFIMNLNKNNE